MEYVCGVKYFGLSFDAWSLVAWSCIFESACLVLVRVFFIQIRRFHTFTVNNYCTVVAGGCGSVCVSVCVRSLGGSGPGTL
jgi:hypothetical protein